MLKQKTTICIISLHQSVWLYFCVIRLCTSLSPAVFLSLYLLALSVPIFISRSVLVSISLCLCVALSPSSRFCVSRSVWVSISLWLWGALYHPISVLVSISLCRYVALSPPISVTWSVLVAISLRFYVALSLPIFVCLGLCWSLISLCLCVALSLSSYLFDSVCVGLYLSLALSGSLSFHKFSWQLSAFSLCSSGLISALLAVSYTHLTLPTRRTV